MLNDPSKTNLVLHIEDSKQFLSDYVSQNKIFIQEGFPLFFEKLMEKLFKEKSIHLQIINDEQNIHKVKTELIKTIETASEKLIEANLPIYLATDFLNDFANNPEMHNPEIFTRRFQELKDYINNPTLPNQPFDLKKSVVSQIIPNYIEEFEENLNELVKNKQVLPLRQLIRSIKNKLEDDISQVNSDLTFDFEKQAKYSEEMVQQLKEKILLQERNMQEMMARFENLFESQNNRLILLEKNENTRLEKKKLKQLKKEEAIYLKLQELNLFRGNEFRWNLNELLKKGLDLNDALKLLDDVCVLSKIKTVELSIDFNALDSLLAPEKQKTIFESISNFKIASYKFHEKIFNLGSNKWPFISTDILNTMNSVNHITQIILDFSHGKNSVDDNIINNFANGMKNVDTLTTLFLNLAGGNNQVGYVGICSLAMLLKYSKSLSRLHLDFSGNDDDLHRITDFGVEMFARSLCGLKSMTSLSLNFSGSNNAVGSRGIQMIAKSLADMLLLTSLFLNCGGGNNEVLDCGIEDLSNSIQKLTSLKVLFLDFSGTNADSKIPKSRSSEVRTNRGMKTKILSNNLTDTSLVALSGAVKDLTLLNQLTLNFGSGMNKITDIGVTAIANNLQNKKILNCLSLGFGYGNNDITDAGVESLSLNLLSSTFLKRLILDFSKNKVTQVGHDAINKLKEKNSQLKIQFYM